MTWLREVLSDETGHGSSTRTITVMAAITMCVGLLACIAMQLEDLADSLIVAIVALAGGTYGMARFSTDSVKKTEIKANAPQMPNVNVEKAENVDASITAPK